MRWSVTVADDSCACTHCGWTGHDYLYYTTPHGNGGLAYWLHGEVCWGYHNDSDQWLVTATGNSRDGIQVWYVEDNTGQVIQDSSSDKLDPNPTPTPDPWDKVAQHFGNAQLAGLNNRDRNWSFQPLISVYQS